MEVLAVLFGTMLGGLLGLSMGAALGWVVDRLALISEHAADFVALMCGGVGASSAGLGMSLWLM
jgi:hypothetical protein